MDEGSPWGCTTYGNCASAVTSAFQLVCVPVVSSDLLKQARVEGASPTLYKARPHERASRTISWRTSNLALFVSNNSFVQPFVVTESVFSCQANLMRGYLAHLDVVGSRVWAGELGA